MEMTWGEAVLNESMEGYTRSAHTLLLTSVLLSETVCRLLEWDAVSMGKKHVSNTPQRHALHIRSQSQSLTLAYFSKHTHTVYQIMYLIPSMQ